MSDDRLKSILDDRDSGAPISRIVRAMSEWGALSGAEIARRTGLARSTVSVALSKLRESGIVVELPEQAEASKGVGRPATPLALNPEAGTCVGVHLALDELRIAVADVAHSVIDEQSVPLGRDYAPEAAAEAARSAIASVYAAHGLRPSGLLGVGISVSGPLRPDGRVIRASILPRWAGVNMRDVFGPVLERPVFAANESNCAAIAEMTWGAAAGEDDFVLFKIDVGLGGAIVRDGTVLTGIAGGAGEFGHVSIDPQGPLCRCGNRGCLELYVSLEALQRRGGGEEEWVDDVAPVFARAVRSIENLFDPQTVIMGGIAPPRLLARLAATTASLGNALGARSDRTVPRILVARGGPNSVLRGAATLAVNGVLAPNGGRAFSKMQPVRPEELQ